jgi:hypothetical protein
MWGFLVSDIQPYRRDRVRKVLAQQVADRDCQALVKRDAETLYPQPMQSSGIQPCSQRYTGHYNPTVEPQVVLTQGLANNLTQNRMALWIGLVLAAGASVSLVLLSIGGMVETIVRSGQEPAPNIWVRNEQIRSQ